MESANERQVAGGHYQLSAIQPWDIVAAWELNFWQGNVIKYILRAPHKNGKEDFEKARHYIDYLIENYERLFTKSATDYTENIQPAKGRKRKTV